jgi:formylglycine-generating enzyme required for sulfatase activity
VIKGGNWAFGAGIARNAFRFGLAPDLCIDVTGFRVAAAAGRYEAAATKNADDARSRDLSLEQKATALLARVKSLTESGRRAEAQKLVEEFKKSVSKEEPRAGSGLDFVEQVLESMIDISQPKNLQSFTNSLKMKMVRVPAGAFIMGSSQTDIGWAMATLARDQPASLENEYPFHKVRISRPFFIGATEVTVAQFRAFVEETGYVTDAEDEGGGQVYNLQERAFERKSGATWKNPGWKIEDSQPVVMISYNDAQAFCDWLAAKEKLPYKLPTEAQWEYACRGGLPMSQFPWGDELPDGRRANYADKNTDFPWRDRYVDDGYKYVAPVGSYEPNGYGLYDMAGNALEWVRDFYGENYYRFSPEIDPEGPGQGENRVMKGGEWTFGPVNLRCAFRGWARQDLSFYNSGFRVAIDLANSRRAFHFSNTFLTKEWVPGPDQREIAGAIAKEKDRQRSVAKTGQKKVSAPTKQSGASPPVMGIRVLDFTPKSEAKKAGLIKGDVIIEYYGVRDLTSEKLLALTAQAKRQKAKPSLVFVRDGYEYTVKVGLGFLGVTVVDTSVRGPFKRPDFKPEREDQDRPRDERTKARDWT